MNFYSVSTVQRAGLLKSWSSWLSEIREGLKARDRLVLSILVLGFFSTTGYPEMGDLGSVLASKVLRISTALFSFMLASRTLYSPNTQRIFLQRPVSPFLLFFFVCALSVSVSESPLMTCYKSFEVFLVIMLIVEGIVNEESRPDSMIRWMIGLIVAQLCVAWIEGLVLPGLAWATPAKAKSVVVHALHGVYPLVNANTLGYFGGIILIYGLCALLSSHRRTLTAYFLFVLGFITIPASYSRTSLFATSAALLFVLIAFRRIGVVILLSAILSLAMASAPVRTNIIKHIDRGRDSTNIDDFTSGRLGLWQKTLERFSGSFVLGKGYGAAFRTGGIEDATNAHNSYIEVFSGVGVVGFCLWVYTLSTICVHLTALWQKQPGRSRYRHLTVLALLIYLLAGSMGNTRGVYLDYSMLLLASIIVYVAKSESGMLSYPRLSPIPRACAFNHA